MKLPLSSRMLACCAFVEPGDRVADVGCDHGYLGIHLLLDGTARSVIASDINPMPLASARRNAAKFGVSDKMTFHMSSGVRHIPHDFDTLVCAGLGGDTMMSILSDAPWLRDPRYRLILQCQSKRPALRQWLYEQGYAISRETLAKDGKFVYSIMEVTYAPGRTCEAWQWYVSQQLLEENHPLLPEYLGRVCQGLRLSVEGMARSGEAGKEDLEGILRKLEQLEVGR